MLPFPQFLIWRPGTPFSAYDAAYLELARRKSLPLASRDEPLKAAARKSGVKLL